MRMCKEPRRELTFVVNWLLNSTNHTPRVIMNGSSIMMLELEALKIRLIDSVNFLAFPRAELPAMFGLQGEVRKGFFPHRFN